MKSLKFQIYDANKVDIEPLEGKTYIDLTQYNLDLFTLQQYYKKAMKFIDTPPESEDMKKIQLQNLDDYKRDIDRMIYRTSTAGLKG